MQDIKSTQPKLDVSYVNRVITHQGTEDANNARTESIPPITEQVNAVCVAAVMNHSRIELAANCVMPDIIQQRALLALLVLSLNTPPYPVPVHALPVEWELKSTQLKQDASCVEKVHIPTMSHPVNPAHWELIRTALERRHAILANVELKRTYYKPNATFVLPACIRVNHLRVNIVRRTNTHPTMDHASVTHADQERK